MSIDPELLKLPVLSIRQPWAWLIVHGGKDIENRCWRTSFRGRFLIHAAKGCTRDEYAEGRPFAREMFGIGQATFKAFSAFPQLHELERGGIVGVAEITDCVRQSQSGWFFGPWGFVLANVQPLPFHPCKGQLGFFYLPAKP